MKKNIDNMNLKKFSNVINPIIHSSSKKNPVHVTHKKTNVFLRKDKIKYNLVTFLHGTMCPPDPRTWEKAIKTDTLFVGQI